MTYIITGTEVKWLRRLHCLFMKSSLLTLSVCLGALSFGIVLKCRERVLLLEGQLDVRTASAMTKFVMVAVDWGMEMSLALQLMCCLPQRGTFLIECSQDDFLHDVCLSDK